MSDDERDDALRGLMRFAGVEESEVERLRTALEAKREELAAAEANLAKVEKRSDDICIVFDGPPSHESGRFIEVEDTEGRGISVGAWEERDRGEWVLRIPRCSCAEFKSLRATMARLERWAHSSLPRSAKKRVLAILRGSSDVRRQNAEHKARKAT